MKDPTAFASLGGKLPKGVLLTGYVVVFLHVSVFNIDLNIDLLVPVKLYWHAPLLGKQVSHFSSHQGQSLYEVGFQRVLKDL